MTQYRVTYTDSRVGRNHNVEPHTVDVVHVGSVGAAVVQEARKHLASSGVDYDLDYADDHSDAHGFIYAGARAVAEYHAVRIDQPEGGSAT